MPYSIGEAAKIAHVSVRTLHHYDALGLLQPSIRSDAGYRFYHEQDLQRLHQILFYRALGFSLKQIRHTIDAQPEERLQQLQAQRQLLDDHLARLQHMKQQLEQELSLQELSSQEKSMNTQDQFDALNGFDPDQFEAEAKSKWGDTDAYKESAKRTSQYNKADWAKYQQSVNALNQQMADLMDRQIDAASDEAIEVAEKMRLLIDQWFYPCSRQMHANLGEMYVQDPRFAENYDKVREGLAGFIQHAAAANFELNGD